MKKNNGMTFIEILIAIVIAGMVLSSIFTCINFASKYARHNANKTMALNFAQGLMEKIKNAKFKDLNDYNEYTDTVLLYQKDDANIEALRSVEIGIDDDNSYRDIKVTVSWDWQGKHYEEKISTIRSSY